MKKQMFAQDSEHLIVLFDIKHRGLLSYYLPRVIAWICLGGLTVYGIFGFVPLIGKLIVNLLK